MSCLCFSYTELSETFLQPSIQVSLIERRGGWRKWPVDLAEQTEYLSEVPITFNLYHLILWKIQEKNILIFLFILFMFYVFIPSSPHPFPNCSENCLFFFALFNQLFTASIACLNLIILVFIWILYSFNEYRTWTHLIEDANQSFFLNLAFSWIPHLACNITYYRFWGLKCGHI